MHDDRIDTLRRAAKHMRDLSLSLPDGPWTSTANDYDHAAAIGCPWDPDTYWVDAPRQPEETRTIALAYGNLAAEHLTRVDPRTLRAMAWLLDLTATEYEGMRRSALYLDVSDREAAERLRRGPFGLNAALAVAMSFLGELEDKADEDQDEEDELDG